MQWPEPSPRKTALRVNEQVQANEGKRLGPIPGKFWHQVASSLKWEAVSKVLRISLYADGKLMQRLTESLDQQESRVFLPRPNRMCHRQCGANRLYSCSRNCDGLLLMSRWLGRTAMLLVMDITEHQQLQ